MLHNETLALQPNRATRHEAGSFNSVYKEILQRKEHDIREDSGGNFSVNSKSEEMGEEASTRRWAIMYQGHLDRRIVNKDPIGFHFDDDDLPDLAALSITDDDDDDGPCSISSVETPTEDSSLPPETEHTSWSSLHKSIVELSSSVLGDPTASDNEIAFRVFDDDSKSKYFENEHDIRCGNWQEFDINKGLVRREAKRHIEGDKVFPSGTDYISISTSPLRALNVANWRRDISKDQQLPKIAIIDLRILGRLGIAHGSTINDLGFTHHNKRQGTGTKYATEHHRLVVGWLPCCSILGILSYEQFIKLLVDSNMDVYADPNLRQSEDYDTTISFKLISTSLKQNEIRSPCYKCRVDT
ncbi:hypothetical protein F4805DRAFT_244590 [Annulohypoxylon moriforme]|nr:hypothetical protein F4805DRAFT_244590 [Annulohypoxylon moriforme]